MAGTARPTGNLIDTLERHSKDIRKLRARMAAQTFTHDHDSDYSDITHDHDADYSALSHNHDSDYLSLGGGNLTGVLDMQGNNIDMGAGYIYYNGTTDPSVRFSSTWVGLYNGVWNVLGYSDRTEVRTSLRANEYVFYGDEDTGVYPYAANEVGVKVGGLGMYRFDGPSGLAIYGNNPYTTAQAWLTLDSPSSGGSYDDQVAGISLGESGYKGNAAGHIVYTGDGYTHFGGGSVTNGANPPMASPAFKLYYDTTSIRHDFTGAWTASGWDKYSNSSPGSVRLDTGNIIYQHTSSERYKEDLRVLGVAQAYKALESINAYTYQGITPPGRNKLPRSYGFSAEEMYAAQKRTDTPAGTLASVDQDGLPDSVSMEGPVSILWVIVKDQAERIEALEAALA